MTISQKTWAETLDDKCRFADMKVQRYEDNLLSRFGVKRQNIEAFLWPSLIATALWTGMPTLKALQLVGIAVGIIFFALLVVANRKSQRTTQDLAAQVILLFALAFLIWVIGPDEAGTGSIVYRHLLIPVVVIVGITLLIAGLMAKRLGEPLQAISSYGTYLANAELFQARGTRVQLARAPLTRFFFAVLGVLLRPLQLFWPVAIAVLIAPPAYVSLIAWIAFGVMATILFLAVSDERLDNSLSLLMFRFFRKAAFGVTLVTLALAVARLMQNTYVTTIFDSASGVEIVLYFFFAYAIAWWYDYWIDRLIGQQLLELIDHNLAGGCAAAYNYTGAVVTSVPLVNRRIELEGLGRFLAYCPNPGNPTVPYFQAWNYNDFFSLLASAGAPGGKGTPLPEQIRQRVREYLGCAGIAAIALFALGGWQLHRIAKAPELIAGSHQPAALTLSSLMNDPKRDQTQPVIMVSASGGGTRAAVFTGAVLEGISQTHGNGILAGSGVSGGSAALAYFASNRPDLIASKPGSWDEFFTKLSMPFIQDVIERAAEWRMVEHGRMGVLLAESFERRWKLNTNRESFGDVEDFGLICNTTLAGHFDLSFLQNDEGKGMDLGEAATRYLNKTRSEVAGGRLILTNLDLRRAFASPSLPFIPGEHLPILVNDQKIRLERGAALSANFPPVFSNAGIDIDAHSRYWITDGGAADNRGLEPLLFALDDALNDGAQKLPRVVVVVIEASGIDEGFSQNRGLGSKLGAGAHFADQLDAELAGGLIAKYRAAHQEEDLKFLYVPMPSMLRTSGSFGTHWMLQDYITVTNESGSPQLTKTFTGKQVVAGLRGAYSGQRQANDSELTDWIIATPEFKQWCDALSSLGSNSAGARANCHN